MKRFLSFLLLSAVALCLTACNITPMFYPPVDSDFRNKHTDAETAQKLTGNWIQYNEKQSVDFQLKAAYDSKNMLMNLHLTIPAKNDTGKEYQTDLFLQAAMIRVQEEFYLICFVDLGESCKKTNLSAWNCFLLRPLFLAVRLTLKGDGSVEYQNILFSKTTGGKDEQKKMLSDPSVRMEQYIVMNKTEELTKFLIEKKYFLDEPKKLVREPEPKEEGKK